MNRHGFALLTTLWLVTAASVLTAAGVLAARLGVAKARNRILLTRAAWARESCLEMVRSAYHDRGLSALLPTGRASWIAIDSIDLGGDTWCAATVTDPNAALNINVGDSAALAAVLASDSLAGVLVRARPLPSIDSACLLIEPFPCAAAASLLTVRGTGKINVNSASAPVLATLPGVSPILASLIVNRRAPSPLAGLDDLLRLDGAAEIREAYSLIGENVTFSADQIVVTVMGQSGVPPLTASVIVTLVPEDHRLAVLRRESS